MNFKQLPDEFYPTPPEHRKNLCVDCDNAECAFMGKKEADCPKWTCDRPNQAAYHCDRRAFIDRCH